MHVMGREVVHVLLAVCGECGTSFSIEWMSDDVVPQVCPFCVDRIPGHVIDLRVELI